MKRLTAFVLVVLSVFAFVGCSGNEEKVWQWAQNLTQEDIISAIPRSGVDSDECIEFEPLNDAETLELVTLLNGLTKDSFTENKDLRGITPTFHLEIKIGSETYYINEANAPDGVLEMKYQEKQWWIDDAALTEFVKKVTNTQPVQ